mmetsp:Transcript_10719/g.13980  ORF Transcript_10719/g.13980 Transcript_10719/m.13980 type:complete len:212 (-) Transcript_10719:763-1398(-)
MRMEGKRSYEEDPGGTDNIDERLESSCFFELGTFASEEPLSLLSFAPIELPFSFLLGNAFFVFASFEERPARKCCSPSSSSMKNVFFFTTRPLLLLIVVLVGDSSFDALDPSEIVADAEARDELTERVSLSDSFSVVVLSVIVNCLDVATLFFTLSSIATLPLHFISFSLSVALRLDVSFPVVLVSLSKDSPPLVKLSGTVSSFRLLVFFC